MTKKKNLKVAEFESDDLTKSVAVILDAFSGGDGGVSFVSFCGLIRDMDKRAIHKGDEAAKKITDVVRQFAKLIKVAEIRMEDLL